MKRISALVIVAISLLTLATSCQKNGYGTYEFFTTHWYTVRDQARLDQIADIIQQDDYFFTKHAYKGTLDECVLQATKEFQTHINALDTESIEALLQPYFTTSEQVTISLWSADPGQRWLGYIIRNDGMTTAE